ncbi:heavy-metal-associated domain-containing protein [Noviherbaspirillum galbum]|uniref:Heavy-metal-associated domain-containing protein n=1 Tax=Noviherbaspirillum galbum TaxID=2709383 RepID=A0A6B3STT5_9BURK|nr:heavy-metal-associated domain-containing protein [Noviherbaspirillum galbum]NEX62276.1 heavy-metal-associated domain-containing protein [Noviherbaspirillum galbum]
METEIFKLSGIASETTANFVARVLQEVSGVSHVQIDIGCQKAVVAFDGNKTSRQELLATLKRAGFSVAGMRSLDLGAGGGCCGGGCR